jgi:hypothetical protein
LIKQQITDVNEIIKLENEVKDLNQQGKGSDLGGSSTGNDGLGGGN